jgi:hypothetical protein
MSMGDSFAARMIDPFFFISLRGGKLLLISITFNTYRQFNGSSMVKAYLQCLLAIGILNIFYWTIAIIINNEQMRIFREVLVSQ